MRTCYKRHPDPKPDECETCYRYTFDSNFRTAMDRFMLRVSTRTSVKSVPCKHRGDQLDNSEAAKMGLSVIRNWFPCALHHGRNGFVCPCEGCGPACEDYAADPDGGND